MSAFADKLLPTVRKTLRVIGDEFDDEITSYIDTCAIDLQTAGILNSYFSSTEDIDPQIVQAVRWYCLSVFGLYNADSEKYAKSYGLLKATLCTQHRYTGDINSGI